MIIKCDNDNLPEYNIDIGRPDFYNERTIQYWKKFHDWVENCEIPIIVNSMFSGCVKMLNEGEMYMGGGFKYMFWFHTKEDLEKFRKDINNRVFEKEK